VKETDGEIKNKIKKRKKNQAKENEGENVPSNSRAAISVSRPTFLAKLHLYFVYFLSRIYFPSSKNMRH
jgi:hypothetical protein